MKKPLEIKSKTKIKKKKEKPPITKAVDRVYRTVLAGNYLPSMERISTSQALLTLRGIEIKKTEDLEAQLLSAYRACREKIIRTLLSAVLHNNLRLVDTQIILEMLRNEISMMGAWEYEHLDEADDIIAPTNTKEDDTKTLKSLELFKALGVEDTETEEDNHEPS
jgi:hypothetical protein